jgi:hypothetical protein
MRENCWVLLVGCFCLFGKILLSIFLSSASQAANLPLYSTSDSFLLNDLPRAPCHLTSLWKVLWPMTTKYTHIPCLCSLCCEFITLITLTNWGGGISHTLEIIMVTISINMGSKLDLLHLVILPSESSQPHTTLGERGVCCLYGLFMFMCLYQFAILFSYYVGNCWAT